MRLLFLVNSAKHQQSHFSTRYLVDAAQRRKAPVFFVEAETLQPDFKCVATTVDIKSTLNTDIKSTDVVMVRFNPSGEYFRGNISQILSILEDAERTGTQVINAPKGLRTFGTKASLAQLPSECTPPFLVSENFVDILNFCKTAEEDCVLKPVAGWGGQNVVRLSPFDPALESQINLVLAQGSVLVQPFLDSNISPNKRVLLIDGQILKFNNQPCLYARESPNDEFRSNIRLGAQAKKTTLSPEESFHLGSIAPILKQQGLRFVGVDFLAHKILELNVYCTGGIHPIHELYQHNVSDWIIEQLLQPNNKVGI